MHEGLPKNNNVSMEEFNRKSYEGFRKEILDFKGLPESTFSEQKDNFEKLEPQESKNIFGHRIMEKIKKDTTLSEQQVIELAHLWEENIMGITEKRTMYDGEGNVM